MNVRPFGAMILVEREASEQRSAGGIFIPDSAQKKTCRGTVLAVGPGRYDEHGNFRAMNDPVDPPDVRIAPGDRIAWDRDGAHAIPWDEKLLLVSRDFVLAKLEDSP